VGLCALNTWWLWKIGQKVQREFFGGGGKTSAKAGHHSSLHEQKKAQPELPVGSGSGSAAASPVCESLSPFLSPATAASGPEALPFSPVPAASVPHTSTPRAAAAAERQSTGLPSASEGPLPESEPGKTLSQATSKAAAKPAVNTTVSDAALADTQVMSTTPVPGPAAVTASTTSENGCGDTALLSPASSELAATPGRAELKQLYSRQVYGLMA
jgi:hypothetical protein